MSGYIGSKTSVTLVDGYTQAEADAEFVAKAGDTMTGGLTVGGTVTATDFSGDGSSLTSLAAANLTGTLPAIDGSALTGVGGSTTAGAVGTYAYLLHKTRDIGIIQGSTYAGSSMVYSGQSTNSLTSASGYSVGHGLGCATASGTWRAMGSRGSTTGYDYFATLFVRIS